MACSAVSIALFPPDNPQDEILFGESRKEHWVEKVAPWVDLAIGVALLTIGILGMQTFLPIGTVPSQILFGVGAAYLSFSIVIAFVHVKNKIEDRTCHSNEEYAQPKGLSFIPSERPSPPPSPISKLGSRAKLNSDHHSDERYVRTGSLFEDWSWGEGDSISDG